MQKSSSIKGLDHIYLFLTRYRKVALMIVLLITGVFLYGAFHIRGEVIVKDMFPYDHPYLKLQERFAQIFGSGGSGLAIAVKVNQGDIFNEKSLGKIKAITEEVAMWEEVYRSLTVSLASYATKVVKTMGKGEIKVQALMNPDVPKDEKGMEELKVNIFSNPSYSGTLVSEDGMAGLVMTAIKEDIPYPHIFKKLRDIVKRYSDADTSIHIVGFPMLMGWIYSVTTEMYMVFGISILGIAVLLFLIYRSFLGMMAPLLNAGILTIWGLGFVGFTKINFSPMLYVLAFLVGARMLGNANQIIYRYFEEMNESGGDKAKACFETMRTMWIPNCAAVATDAAGFLVLIVAKIVLIQHLAIIMSFWMMSIVMTGFLVPVMCSIMPLKTASNAWAKENCQIDGLARVMMKITNFSIGPRTRYVVGALIVLVALVSFSQMTHLKIGDATPGSPIFYNDHPYNQDQAVLNNLFDASSEQFVLYWEGKPDSAYKSVVTETFEKFVLHMAKTLPDIYKTSNSVIDSAKMLNQILHEGDDLFYTMPTDLEQLYGLIGYTRQQLGNKTFQRYIDSKFERSQIILYFADHTSDNLKRIRDAAFDFFKNNPMQTPEGEFRLAGGRIGMEIALNEEMKITHGIVDLMVLSAIFLLCSFSYRSFIAGFMLTLPLILANCLAGAYMAWQGIGLSINTLPVAAIGVGVGVDFAIYLYSRCKEEYIVQDGDWTATILESICTCGKAVVYTGLTVILPIISWYFFSDMKFQAEVGFFLSMIMGTNVILTLTLHPLMIYLIKPKFLTKLGKQKVASNRVEVPAVS